jgi:hypothetical protein
MKESHSVFHEVVTKRATDGLYSYQVPTSTFDHDTNFYFILRSRKKKASNVMVASELFDVAGVDESRTQARQSIRRHTWSKSCVADPAESCGQGWDLISCDTKTSATIIHVATEPMSTFRCKNPVLSAISSNLSCGETDRLVTGSFYFQRRLAYFEVEVVGMDGTSTICCA